MFEGLHKHGLLKERGDGAGRLLEAFDGDALPLVLAQEHVPKLAVPDRLPHLQYPHHTHQRYRSRRTRQTDGYILAFDGPSIVGEQGDVLPDDRAIGPIDGVLSLLAGGGLRVWQWRHESVTQTVRLTLVVRAQ